MMLVAREECTYVTCNAEVLLQQQHYADVYEMRKLGKFHFAQLVC